MSSLIAHVPVSSSWFQTQVAVYGGLIDRVHDLLLCGVDPSMVDLTMCLDHLKSDDKHHVYRETESLLSAASHHWKPSHHAYLYGPELRACIASVCLVKVQTSVTYDHMSFVFKIFLA